MSRFRNETGPEGMGGDCYRPPLPGFRPVGKGSGMCARIAFDSTHRRCCPATATENKLRIEAVEELPGVGVRVESDTACGMETHIKTFLVPASFLSSARQGKAPRRRW